jgi:hypothetical protein
MTTVTLKAPSYSGGLFQTSGFVPSGTNYQPDAAGNIQAQVPDVPSLLQLGFTFASSSATVTLTSAQVLALNTTPINIIPAPAASSLLVVVDYVLYKGTGAYTQSDGAGLAYHGTTTAADYSYAGTKNPFINGTTLSGGMDVILAAATENLNIGSVAGLGVDIAAITTNPSVGTTPVEVTAYYRVLSLTGA